MSSEVGGIPVSFGLWHFHPAVDRATLVKLVEQRCIERGLCTG